jgi:hypothetical protein
VIERLLVIVNAASGTGWRPALPGDLLAELTTRCPGVADVEVAVVRDHPAVRRAARAFTEAGERPAALIAAGGGGTVRAAVEGVQDAGGPGRLVLGALRMGSGNVLARRLGIARDPVAGIRQLASALRAGRVTPVPVLRCRFGDGARHAVVMCGLGQWGRTSGDLARWHRRTNGIRGRVAAFAGIERVNHAEYVAAAGLRLLQAVVSPKACELVEVACGADVERFRLLAGAVIATRVPGLPVEPGVVMVPLGGRPRRLPLREGEALEITLLDRDSVEFFLDEDPEVARAHIRIELAGSLPFLTPEVAS